MEHQTSEGLRKSIHVTVGLFAVALKWIPWRIAALVAAVAVIGNWLILHRLVGKRVARHERGYDAGIILYPLSIFLLIVIFNWHIELAAVAWAILAFGDGTATLIGRAKPIARLPWNGSINFRHSTHFASICSLNFLRFARKTSQDFPSSAQKALHIRSAAILMLTGSVV